MTTRIKHSGTRLLGMILLMSLAVSVAAQQQAPAEILLWPNGAPGSEGKSGAEKIRITAAGDHVVSNIHHPSITVFLPPPGKATGAAIIIAPGGGHVELWIDHEGYHPARWLSEKGITAFVLKYRLARDTNSTYTVDGNALADMQRALRLVRSRAKEWGIDTSRIGVMGFSAGGEVAALSAMRFDNGNPVAGDPVDRLSAKPAFQALIYPGNSKRFEVTKSSPPVFIVCGYQDRPDISEGMATLYLKYKQLDIPAELHIYANVGHGFGVRESTRGGVAGWPLLLEQWIALLFHVAGT
jgi:acetyl esterase/lipase